MTQTKRTRLISFHPRPSCILFHFISNAKHYAGKGFLGHEIFLVDLNKVFFLFFRFWTVNALTGREINKTIKQGGSDKLCAVFFYFIIIIIIFWGAGGGGGVNHENCLLLTNNQYTETGDRIRVLVMSRRELWYYPSWGNVFVTRSSLVDLVVSIVFNNKPENASFQSEKQNEK